MRVFLKLLFFLLLPVLSNADIKPVSPTDNLEIILRAAVPGDIIALADGMYPGGVFFTGRAATAENPIIVRAANPGKATIVGSTATRPDAMAFNGGAFWKFDGLVFQGAAKSGLKPGGANNVTYTRCVFRNNGVSGMQTGTSSFGTVEDCQFLFNAEQHGAYVSGAVKGWTFSRCTFAFNGRSGLQLNSQGSVGGAVSSEHTVKDCSFYANGQNIEAAAINCLGVTNSVFSGCSLSDNKAGGISFMGNGTAVGQSTGNLVSGCTVTFRFAEGRACIQQSGGNLSVAGCRLWNGKANVLPINALSGGVITQAGNVVLPPMPPATGGVTVPDETVIVP